MIFKIIEIERERSVGRAAEDAPDLVEVARLAVGGEAHHLVLAFVDGKAEEGGEGGVEHSQRMRESHLAKQAQIRAAVVPDLAYAHRQGRPLPDAVRGQDRRPPRRRGEERGRGMGLVVLGEEDLPRRDSQLRGDDSLDPQLLAEKVAHRLREAARGAREPAQRHREDALELEHRLLVEDDGVEVLRFELPFVQAEVDGGDGKRGVVLAPGQPLLLHRTDRNAVDHERRGRVVVMRRDAEDAHQYWLLASGSARDAAKPGGSRRAARRARKTKGGKSTKYWTRKSSV